MLIKRGRDLMRDTRSQISFRVDEETKKKFNIYLAKRDLKIQHVMEEYINQLLKEAEEEEQK